MEPFKDWRGNEIEVGDVIYYAVKESCSVVLNEARVTAIETREAWNGKEVPVIKVHWLKSSDGESARAWRMIFDVTLTAMDTITLVQKANAITVTYIPKG